MSITLPRILRTLACAAVMLPAAAQAADFVSITGNTVNVRKQPNTRSEVAWELSKGYPLQIEQRQGQWLKVRDFEESLGWVFSPLTGKTPHRVVTARIANLRAGPGQGHKVVGKLDQHEVVRTLGKQDDWAQVRRESGQRDWVAKRLTWGVVRRVRQIGSLPKASPLGRRVRWSKKLGIVSGRLDTICPQRRLNL